MSNEESTQLYSCEHCGKGIWKGDTFFKCKDEDCLNLDDDRKGELIYCKDCIKRCEKCFKFICKEHFQRHKEDCRKEDK